LGDVEIPNPGPGLTEERYRRLVELSPNAICVHKDGHIVYVNPAGLRLMAAHSLDQMVGHPLTEFVAPESIPPMRELNATMRVVGDYSEPGVAQMMRLDGTVLAVEVQSVLTLWEGEPAYQVISRDRTAQEAAEAALRGRAALINHVSDAIISTTAGGAVTSWNPAAEAIYGRAADQTLGRAIADMVGAPVDPIAMVASGGVVQATHHSADGAALDIRVSAAAMENGYVFVCCDLTPMNRAKEHFEAVVASLAEGVIVLDKDGFIKSINPAAVRILGAGPEHLGGNFFEMTEKFSLYDAEGVNIPPDLRPALAVLRTGVPYHNLVVGMDRPKGKRGWLMSSCRLINPDMPGHSDVLMSFTDITSQRKAADELVFLATHDPLTKLPNRASVLRKVKRALEVPRKSERLRAVLFIDIDELKTTNDTFGHTAGDDLLRAAARRLRNVAGADDVVGRMGGDEFVVLVFRDITHREVGELENRLRRELYAPTIPDVSRGAIRASIGVVEVDLDDQRTSYEILRDADRAMYRAKRARRNGAEGSTNAD
jgi:diguanylate cyclase (GGDEF)-like protein/PAS domain S-box-containing protein